MSHGCVLVPSVELGRHTPVGTVAVPQTAVVCVERVIRGAEVGWPGQGRREREPAPRVYRYIRGPVPRIGPLSRTGQQPNADRTGILEMETKEASQPGGWQAGRASHSPATTKGVALHDGSSVSGRAKLCSSAAEPGLMSRTCVMCRVWCRTTPSPRTSRDLFPRSVVCRCCLLDLTMTNYRVLKRWSPPSCRSIGPCMS